MFKCKECGCEYDKKPDYCDCGNNTFDEISAPEKEIPPTQQEPFKEEIYTQQYIPKHNNTKKTFSEQYPEFERLKNFFDPISKYENTSSAII